MITKHISWSLGAIPNKSPDPSRLLFRFTFRVTLAQLDHAKTAYIPRHPPARSIESIASLSSIPSISLRPLRGFRSLFITKDPSFRRKTQFFT
jgi:hypothetical protein